MTAELADCSESLQHRLSLLTDRMPYFPSDEKWLQLIFQGTMHFLLKNIKKYMMWKYLVSLTLNILCIYIDIFLTFSTYIFQQFQYDIKHFERFTKKWLLNLMFCNNI